MGLWTMTTDNNSKIKIVDIISRALFQIEQDGCFMGNSQTGFRGDNPGYQSTKDKVAEWVKRMENTENTDFSVNSYVMQKDREALLEKANDILMHFKTMKPSNNEFINTCITLAISDKEDMVNKKFIGYVVAMVPTYNKSKEREQFNEEFKDSDYVGVAGKRRNFFIKLINKHHMTDHESWIYTFIDRNKNLVKTWVTYDKHEAWEMNLNDCIDLDAYVRKHEQNRYSKLRETFINRVKIIENKGQA